MRGVQCFITLPASASLPQQCSPCKLSSFSFFLMQARCLTLPTLFIQYLVVCFCGLLRHCPLQQAPVTSRQKHLLDTSTLTLFIQRLVVRFCGLFRHCTLCPYPVAGVARIQERPARHLFMQAPALVFILQCVNEWFERVSPCQLFMQAPLLRDISEFAFERSKNSWEQRSSKRTRWIVEREEITQDTSDR